MGKQFEDVSCTYGAPMGRRTAPDLDTTRGTVHLFKVKLDSGGYDDGGAYWGVGAPLYCARDRDGDIQMIRAPSREEAAFLLNIPAPSLRSPFDWRRKVAQWREAGTFDSDALDRYEQHCMIAESEPRGLRVSIVHVDTCLPDYFRGDSRPWLCIPAYRQSFASVRRALEDEVRQGAIGGHDDYARLLQGDMVRPEEEKLADELTRKVYAAIRRDVRPAKKGDRLVFRDIEPHEDGADCVMAYFVILVEGGPYGS